MYKKYIEQKNKLFKPYLYKTRRVNEKIITAYSEKAKKRNINHIYFSLFMLLLVVLLLFIIFPKSLTGSVVREYQDILESKEEVEVLDETNTNIGIETIQDKAILNQPVKWQKKIKLSIPANISILLPEDAKNISVKIIQENQTLEINETEINETLPVLSNESTNEIPYSETINNALLNKTFEETNQSEEPLPLINETNEMPQTANNSAEEAQAPQEIIENQTENLENQETPPSEPSLPAKSQDKPSEPIEQPLEEAKDKSLES